MARSTEMFIELVQKYPVLYDVSHTDYKNTRMKNKIWIELCQILGESSEDNGEALKKQWKNLRDAYMKHIRACTGQVAKHIDRYKAWPWAAYMTFLRPHVELAESPPNIKRGAEEDGCSNLSVRANEEVAENLLVEFSPYEVEWAVDDNDSNGEAFDATETFQQNIAPQPVRARRKRKRHQPQPQPQVDKVMPFNNQNEEEEDETDLLFKSYAKRLKKMDRRRRAKVKFEIAKIMMQAELEESDELQPRADSEQRRASGARARGGAAPPPPRPRPRPTPSTSSSTACVSLPSGFPTPRRSRSNGCSLTPCWLLRRPYWPSSRTMRACGRARRRPAARTSPRRSPSPPECAAGVGTGTASTAGTSGTPGTSTPTRAD